MQQGAGQNRGEVSKPTHKPEAHSIGVSLDTCKTAGMDCVDCSVSTLLEPLAMHTVCKAHLRAGGGGGRVCH